MKRCLVDVSAALYLDGTRYAGATESILNVAEGHVACAAAIDLFEDVTDA